MNSLQAEDLARVGRWDRESKFAQAYQPRAAGTGKLYRGQNKALLTAAARVGGWRSSYWATFGAWKKLGCCPRPGERPARVWFRNYYHSVFNLEQCEIIHPAPELDNALAELEQIGQEQVLEMPTGDNGAGWNAYRWNIIRTKQAGG